VLVVEQQVNTTLEHNIVQRVKQKQKNDNKCSSGVVLILTLF
jgi:hypothetical protein